MANPTSFLSVVKTVFAAIFLFLIGMAILLGILYVAGFDLNSKVFEPIDHKLSHTFCKHQLQSQNWTDCIGFSQTRTSYYCNFTSKYNWVSYTEKQACVPAAQKEQYFLIRYNWTYEGKKYNWEYVFPKSIYDYYRLRERANTNDYTIYASDSKDDEIISNLVDQFNDYADKQGFDKYEKVNFIISFVQGLPYTSDNVTTGHDEYPRYPIETLVDNGGDCEDTSILTAVLLNEMDYDVVLLEFQDHMSVGVSCEPDVGTHYIDSSGNTFCYLETSGENWKIGMVPENYAAKIPEIRHIIPKPILDIQWNSTGKATIFSSTYEIKIKLKNEGAAPANSIMVWAGFDTQDETQVYTQKEIGPFKINSNEELTKEITLTIKPKKYTRLHIIVSGSNFKSQQSFSEWLTT